MASHFSPVLFPETMEPLDLWSWGFPFRGRTARHLSVCRGARRKGSWAGAGPAGSPPENTGLPVPDPINRDEW